MVIEWDSSLLKPYIMYITKSKKCDLLPKQQIKVNMQMTIWVGVQDQWSLRAACNVIFCLSNKL